MFGNMKRIFHHGSNPLKFVNACKHLSNSFASPLAVSLYSTGKSQKDQDLLRADPKSTLGFKHLFNRDKDVLKDFLGDVLKEHIFDVKYEETYCAQKHAVQFLMCHGDSGSHTVALLLSTVNHPFLYSFRYTLLLYISERNWGKNSSPIMKPVFLITICNHNIVPETEKQIYFWETEEVDTTNEFTKERLRWVRLELPKFEKDVTEINELRDNVEVWSYFLKYAPILEDDQVKKLSVMKPCIQKAFDSLRLSTWDHDDRVDYTEENRMAQIEKDVKMKLAVKMLEEYSADSEEISAFLDLPVQEIEDLKN